MILKLLLSIVIVAISINANAGMARKFCKLHYEKQVDNCDSLLSNNSTDSEFFYKSWSINHNNGFNQASNFEVGNLEFGLKNNFVLACREGSGRHDLPIFRARNSQTPNQTIFVKYRIDQGATFAEDWSASTDSNGRPVIFPIEAEEFVNRINNGSILIISYAGVDGRDVVSTFNLDGILQLNDINRCK